MNVVRTALEGLLIVEPDVHRDGRGFFLEAYRADRYRAAGVDADFVQDNHSRSGPSVVRGLHFQEGAGQAKLIRVARGRIYDVAVDVRPGSPTYGRHAAVILDDRNHRQLFVPPGFAHGFATLGAQADVVYKVGSYYDSSTERGLAWNDPELAIEWPVVDPRVSERDRHNPRLAELRRPAMPPSSTTSD